MSIDRIPGEANLYISGLFSLRRPDALKSLNITHIVTALRQPLEPGLVDGYQHYVVAVDDDGDGEDVVREFAGSNEFIERGLREGDGKGGGGVLVHCAMGKSRSATIITAYLLSHPPPPSNTLTPTTALALVRSARRMAEPNPGFMAQLNLYHRLGCPATLAALEAHPGYQEWLYQRNVESSNARGVAPTADEIYFADTFPTPAPGPLLPKEEGTLESTKMTETTTAMDVDTPPTPAETATPIPTETVAPTPTPSSSSSTETPTPPQPPTLTYRCRLCRQPLATSTHVLDHAAGSTINFASRANPLTYQRTIAPTTAADRCAHLFLEPLSWMRPELQKGLLEGRLNCPNGRCGGVVGRYAWQGIRCSCGAWVVPGVALGWGRIDEVRTVVRKGGPVGGGGGGGGGGVPVGKI